MPPIDLSAFSNSSFTTLGLLSLLALVPLLLILTTSFTRISIVLTFVRQALSTSVPSAQIIIALSLILTGFVMQPVFKEIYDKALKPSFENNQPLGQEQIKEAWAPLRDFMLAQTREKDLLLFLNLGKVALPAGEESVKQLPWTSIIPAFILSELRTAFLMGFLLFLPFLIIDLVVSSLLMSLGMVMLPPLALSFPFKILLFVLVDGWRLILQQLVVGYQG